jgi:hypothetical protein
MPRLSKNRVDWQRVNRVWVTSLIKPSQEKLVRGYGTFQSGNEGGAAKKLLSGSRTSSPLIRA